LSKIEALSPNGAARRALAAALARPKFAPVLTEDRSREIIELLAAAALWFAPAEKVEDCRDAKDNQYLELARAAGAAAIVSGDGDLLVLDPWRGIRALQAGAFLDLLGAGQV